MHGAARPAGLGFGQPEDPGQQPAVCVASEGEARKRGCDRVLLLLGEAWLLGVARVPAGFVSGRAPLFLGWEASEGSLSAHIPCK